MQQKRDANEEAPGHESKKAHVDESNIDAELLAQEFVDPENGDKGDEDVSKDSDKQESDGLKHHVLHPSSDKPLAGTEEWHRVRKDNHKEVERRRRQTINAGIKELAALLPSPETNKSQIIQRAIEFIKRLKESEKNNVEKWTLEKLLNDQALHELTATNEKLKSELEKAYRDVEHWKKICSIAKTD